MAKKKSAKNGKQAQQGAYFLSLTLRNVRCFGDETQTLDLSDSNGRPARWTILLGENGAGKTTLLQALAGFLIDPNGILAQANDRVHSEFGGLPRLLESEFPYGRSLPSLRRVHLPKSTLLVIKTVFIVIPSITTNSGPRRQHEATIEMEHLEGKWAARGGMEVQPVSTHFPPTFAYGAGRRMSNSGSGSDKRDDACASLFYDDAELRNAEEWLLELDYAASKKSQIQQDALKRRERVLDVLVNILPDVGNVRITNPTKEDWTPNVEFLSHGAWVPLNGMSYGYRTLIAWMVDFSSRMFDRYPNSEDPLAEPAVVLVDEIDLHLHPKWQRKLMDYLSERFPNTQFIATAHSPLIVQAAQDANIAVCRWEGDHVVIDNDVEAIQGWRIDQVLTSDLFGLESARPPQLDALLAERKELLTKATLTKSDEQRLKVLNTEIGSLPVGETTEQAKTISLLEETLEVLKKREK